MHCIAFRVTSWENFIYYLFSIGILKELFEFHHWRADWSGEKFASCHCHLVHFGDNCLCIGQYFILYHFIAGWSAGLVCGSSYICRTGIRDVCMDHTRYVLDRQFYSVSCDFKSFYFQLIYCSVRCSIDIWCSQWHSFDIISIILCRCLPRSNARNFDHDSNTAIHTDTSRFSDGLTINGLPHCFRHICIDQLCWIRHLGKFLSTHNLKHEILSNRFYFAVIDWRIGFVFAMVAMGATKSAASNSREFGLASCVPNWNSIHNYCANDCITRWNGLRITDDFQQCSRLFGIHCLEK